MAQSSPLHHSVAPLAPAIDRKVWKRLFQAVRAVVTSEIGGKFRLMFAGILLLLVGINGLNVTSSYVGRDLMTAIEQRSVSSFFSKALAYIGVFAALTSAAVLLRFIEERLGLLWRDWLTRRLVGRYLEGGAYLRLKEQGELGNPDQRIAEDARTFTSNTLSFVLMFLNAAFSIVAFSGVMWSISPVLFCVAVGYAALGSLCTIALGRPLVRLNYDQSDREASFRSELLHVGENAESVALLQLEGRLSTRLRHRLEALISNARRIVSVNRNLAFFTTGYQYGIQLVPALIVGPLFMHGKVEFGVITQSAMAFAHLLGAFSLIVTQFQPLSMYGAVLVRLGNFSSVVERPSMPAPAPKPDDEGAGAESLVYDDLTLRSASSSELLVAHLTLKIPTGTRVLVTGTDEARRALFRATALRRSASQSDFLGPASARILCLPERPYVPAGTLRELIVRTGHEHDFADQRIYAVLGELGLEPALKRLGGLDVASDFGQLLSLGEQQLLAVARVVLAAPAFVVFQSPDTTLAPEQLARAFAVLSEASITYLSFGGADAPPGAYDAVLELHAGGAWSIAHARAVPPSTHLAALDA
jgi:vitamin B12/bleomycin/antimicrobial peptide transport system ATP-binding/permease protein